MTKFYFTESQSIHLDTYKYYVCGIKLEEEVMRLHKIRVENISLFHLKKCAVNYVLLLPVMFQVIQYDLCTEV